LLGEIHRFLAHHYEIAHATVQMEYQPCSGSDCHLGDVTADHHHGHHH